MFRPRTWVFLTLALTIFATVTLFAGVFSPLWIFLDCGVIKVFVGLLYRTEEKCTLDADDRCVNAPDSFAGVKYDTPSTHDKDHWSVVAGLEVGGAAMGLILVILFVVYACLFSSKRSLTWLNVLLMLASIFTWLPVGCGLIVFAIYHGDAFTHGPDISNQSFPWSALMCFIAGILLVFITILIRSRCRKESYISQAIPASLDSKMALYPSSKSALITRYFAPSAFREDHLQGLNAVMDQDTQKANQVGEQPTTPALYHSRLDSQPEGGLIHRTSSGGYKNRAYEPDSRTPYNVTDIDHRRLTTEVVLDRQASGQNVDLNNEGNDLIIYKGKDHVRKVDDVAPGTSTGRQSFIGSPREERMSEQREFLYSAQHFSDKDAHRGSKYMVHTGEPNESVNKRLVLSPNNFSEGNVKYNPTYAYRPYSEQVY